MCRRAKILIRRKRERERSASGPVGRPEESTDQTITTWATHGLPSLYYIVLLTKHLIHNILKQSNFLEWSVINKSIVTLTHSVEVHN